MVAEAHRLRHLQVGEAGHHEFGVALGLVDQHALHLGEQAGQGVDLLAQPQPQVGGDLVVAAAPGVQALAGVADELREPRLDVEVHVLELELPVECAGFDFLRDLGQAALDVGKVGRADDALRGEHARMRKAAGDVGAPQAAVEADAGGVALHERIDRLGKQRGPGGGFVGERVG